MHSAGIKYAGFHRIPIKYEPLTLYVSLRAYGTIYSRNRGMQLEDRTWRGAERDNQRQRNVTKVNRVEENDEDKAVLHTSCRVVL